jgi:PKD repeat protein
MNLQMMGVDAKTGVCKKGTEISIKVDPDGGTPPYDIVVDWGDGTQSKAFNVTTDKPPTLTHTYNEAGEYTITIICTDQYGNVCKIIRKVEVE